MSVASAKSILDWKEIYRLVDEALFFFGDLQSNARKRSFLILLDYACLRRLRPAGKTLVESLQVNECQESIAEVLEAQHNNSSLQAMLTAARSCPCVREGARATELATRGAVSEAYRPLGAAFCHASCVTQ